MSYSVYHAMPIQKVFKYWNFPHYAEAFKMPWPYPLTELWVENKKIINFFLTLKVFMTFLHLHLSLTRRLKMWNEKRILIMQFSLPETSKVFNDTLFFLFTQPLPPPLLCVCKFVCWANKLNRQKGFLLFYAH